MVLFLLNILFISQVYINITQHCVKVLDITFQSEKVILLAS